MGGGMECRITKVGDLQATDMIQVFLLVLDLGEKRTRKSILGMIGKSHMGVSLVPGMMRYQKMLQRSLNFYWQSRLLIWQIKSISKKKHLLKIWWHLKRKQHMQIKNVQQHSMKYDDWNQNCETKHLKMKSDTTMYITYFSTTGKHENTWLSMEIWSENLTKRFSLI